MIISVCLWIALHCLQCCLAFGWINSNIAVSTLLQYQYVHYILANITDTAISDEILCKHAFCYVVDRFPKNIPTAQSHMFQLYIILTNVSSLCCALFCPLVASFLTPFPAALSLCLLPGLRNIAHSPLLPFSLALLTHLHSLSFGETTSTENVSKKKWSKIVVNAVFVTWTTLIMFVIHFEINSIWSEINGWNTFV